MNTFLFSNLEYVNRRPMPDYMEPLLARLPDEKKEIMAVVLTSSYIDSPLRPNHSFFCRFKCTCTVHRSPVIFVQSDRSVECPVLMPPLFTIAHGLVWETRWDTVTVSQFVNKSGVTLWQPLGNDLYAWTRASEGYTGNVGGGEIRITNGLGRIQWNAEKTIGTLFEVTS